jgi:DNA-binding response OmpR family regulator
LVLLDIAVPEMDGIEICRAIRSHPSTSHAQVIMVSAVARKEDMAAALEAGAVKFITKPFLIEELLAAVKSVLTVEKS